MENQAVRKQWAAFDENWVIVAYGRDRSECEKALTEYKKCVRNGFTKEFKVLEVNV